MTTTSKENKILNAQGDKNITKKDLMKVFRAAVYLLGILTIFLIVLYMFSYQSEKVFLMIYRIFTIFSFFNLATVILAPNGLFSYGWQGATYWFGGKFITFYMYYIWLCLYSIKRRKRNIIAFALTHTSSFYWRWLAVTYRKWQEKGWGYMCR